MTTKNLTRFEKARLLGARAIQISMGAPLDEDIEKEAKSLNILDPIDIAYLELKANKLPLDVIRRE
ncbi:MAG: DNA-directed RNA polymerase subunit K [Methanobrevibacter sp.]|nr:DNA-directed RNA polymerase subunit K [Methanobrevibacter sp.]